MQIVLCKENYKKIIDKAVSVLEKGGMVIYPSDTVYGIAVDGTNQTAVKALHEFKGRSADQKFSYNFSSIDMIHNFVEINDAQEKILEKYLPGPFTFVINPLVSVRIPKDSIIVDIVRAFGKPTTATSANLTGNPPATKITSLDVKLYLKADLIIENVDFKSKKPSTVVDISSEKPKVLRVGELPFP